MGYGNYSKKYSRHMLSFNYGAKGENFLQEKQQKEW